MIVANGGGKSSDLSSAEILSQTMSAIIGDPPIEGEKGTVGLEASKTATTILEELVLSIGEMDGISEPKAITPTMQSMTVTIGTLLEVCNPCV